MNAGRAPSPPTPLLGRERELARVAALLDEHRTVTIVGTGGCGKTRLAVEIAGGRDDTAFVDLTPLTDPALVLPTVARALGLRESGSSPLVDTLLHHLLDRVVVLVLDNVEHVVRAAEDIAELTARCPGVRVLATSRCPLRVPGEHLLPLSPLPVPEPGTDLGTGFGAVPSVALFVERVRAAQPDFGLTPDNTPVVADVCRALDGLPLALELAAAAVRAHGLVEVLERTRHLLDGAGPPRRGVVDRHLSLDSAITWSVARLDDEAVALFRRLGVFAGGWTVEAAQQVCGEPGVDVRPALATLVEHSLVEAVHRVSGVRYRMLQTLRRYSETLPRGPGDVRTVERHALWCRAIAAGVDACPGPDEVRVFDAAETEIDNLRAALDRCTPARIATGLRTAADLYYLWDIRGYLGEGRRRLQDLLDRPDAAAHPVERQAALQALGLLQLWQDEPVTARATLWEAAALAEHNSDPGGWAWCAGNLGIAHFATGDVDVVAATVERGRELARDIGGQPLWRSTCGLALVRQGQGRATEARELMEEFARLACATGWGSAKASYFLGWFAFVDGDLDEAARLFDTGARAFELIGDHRSLPDCRDGLACVAAARGTATDALDLLAAADALRERGGARRSPYLRVHCDRAARRARAALVPPPGITDREYEVARLVAAGHTNRWIGVRLGISERTAERHLENLRAKLGVRTRAQVAAWVAAVPTSPVGSVAASPDTGATPAPVD
ncbi:helix-turn-helix transcriptional regulator [Pseudonocardia saturnea]